MKRIYHQYTLWEEVDHRMWSSLSSKESAEMLKRAIEFTGNAELYGSYMLRVVAEWPFSCENSLTDKNINRQAWIGHAACALAIGCPEHITRKAWAFLSQQQQDDANSAAAAAIKEWEKQHEAKDSSVRSAVGTQMLFDWYSAGSSAQA